MMEGLVEGLKRAGIPGPVYEPARASVAALHAAGMPILAGTDANAVPASPSSPPFGASLHHELELLVEAGLSAAEALDAATSLPADHFDLADRGRIQPGLRADLVLLENDPLADISATRSIRAVWVAGQRVPLDVSQ
jgi:imidazolonepropionase-like amidohydrolase